MQEKQPAEQSDKPWRLRLQCCGREDGEMRFATSEEADAYREDYTSGPVVAKHGYSSHAGEPGHRRAAIKDRVTSLLDPVEGRSYEQWDEQWPGRYGSPEHRLYRRLLAEYFSGQDCPGIVDRFGHEANVVHCTGCRR